MRISAISSIPFQKKVRISNNENNVDKTLQASALSGLYTTVGAVGVGVLGTDVASVAYSSNAMGTNSSDIVPYSIEMTQDSAPVVAKSSAEHPSSMSTGLYSTRQVAHNLSERTSKKIIPSLENSLKSRENNSYTQTEFSPFEYVEIEDQDDYIDNSVRDISRRFVEKQSSYVQKELPTEDKYVDVDSEMNDLLFSEEEMNTEFEDL